METGIGFVDGVEAAILFLRFRAGDKKLFGIDRTRSCHSWSVVVVGGTLPAALAALVMKMAPDQNTPALAAALEIELAALRAKKASP